MRVLRERGFFTGKELRRVPLPPWLRKRIQIGGAQGKVLGVLEELRLRTVCQEAICPNITECFSRSTATFIILGDACTRGCGFCAVKRGRPQPVEEDEPERLSEAVRSLGLKYVVVTSVTRDDLPDGGSGHFRRVILTLKRHKYLKIEVLVPDFQGVCQNLEAVLEAGPEVFAHNVETVPRLYAEVRPGAFYKRSLGVLEFAKKQSKNIYTKSGLMLGLGERKEEVLAVLRDLRRAGCDMVTLGQYLRHSMHHRAVERFIEPGEFEEYGEIARSLGFLEVQAGPFVRSSYYAEALLKGAER